MTTSLTVASLLGLALLCGPALAETLPTYRVDLVLATTGARHTLYVTDHGCGELHIKSPQQSSFVKVCGSTTDDKRVRLGVERRISDKTTEQSSQVTLVAASGATFEVLDAKLTVKAQ